MRFFDVGMRRYAAFEALAALPRVTHAFSTRGLDVSARRDDLAAQRAANRETMATDLGLDPTRIHYCVQVHRPGIALVRRDDPPGPLEEFDGVVTDVPGAVLMTFSADCPLILAVDLHRGALGLAHASWRCTVAHMATRLIDTLRREFGCDPRDIHAGIGPSAGPTRYEVQQDVYDAAAELSNREALFPKSGGRMCFDLWQANRQALLAAGVPASQIELAGICTMTRTDLFYSYRREGAGCGHFGLMAALTPSPSGAPADGRP